MSDTSILPPPERFTRTCAEYGLVLEPAEIETLGAYLEMLLRANERMNLTTVTDPEWAWIRHIFDSLTLLPFVREAGAKCISDVGTGGGLPGVPLAITLPDVNVTLIEATGKKVDFLREVIETLNLKNISVVNARAEAVGHDSAHREQYDMVVSRAVGKLQVLIEYTVPLAKVGGHVLAIKGGKAPEEIAEAKQALYFLHCQVVLAHETPTGRIVVIEKMRKTPKQYPRRPGEPKRKPLA